MQILIRILDLANAILARSQGRWVLAFGMLPSMNISITVRTQIIHNMSVVSVYVQAVGGRT